MPNVKTITFLLVFSAAIVQSASVSAFIINPSDDGWITDNGMVSNESYVITYGFKRGVIEFPTNQLSEPITVAYLSVNPYALPLTDFTLEVYGYESSDGQLTSSDYNAGTFLGILYLPQDLGFGQDAFFEVTTFLQGASTPFVGFNLRSEEGMADIFSSVEFNYGHPSQLLVSPIPEPQTFALLLAGLPLLVIRRQK